MTNVRSFIVGLVVLVLLFIGGIYVYQKSIKPTILNRNATASTSPSPIAKFSKPTTPEPTPITQISQAPQKTDVSMAPSTGEDPQNVGISLQLHLAQNKISSPTVLTGSANVPDGKVFIQIKDANGNILGHTTATACMAANACSFRTNLMFRPSESPTGTLEAFANPTANNPQPYLQTINVSF